MIRYFIASLIILLIGCGYPNKKSSKEILERKAFGLYENNLYPEAILYLDTLITLDSMNGEYFYKRAYSYDMIAKKNKALSDYQKAISLNYKVAKAYYNLAIDAMHDDDSLALFYFDKVLKADPSKYLDVVLLVKTCKEDIEFKKTDAWKDYEKYKKRTEDSVKAK